MLKIAKKMDFGRIKNIESVNYTLPADHKSIIKILGGKRAVSPKIYVGGVLWADESFIGNLYPEKTKAKDFLKHYAKQLNTIELNLTHYRLPEYENLKRWYNTAPTGFKFCPKVHQSISHADNLLSKIGLHNECSDLFTLLGDKLGACFMQLPPQFDTSRINELLEFLDNSNARNLAVEVRHPAWFKTSEALKTLSNYLYKNDMSLVLTDTPGRRDVLHMRLTNKTAFIRFNANDLHITDKQRIDDWMNHIKMWLDNGLEELYFFMHTPHQINMPHLVIYFIKKLQEVCGIKLVPPNIKPQTESKNSLF